MKRYILHRIVRVLDLTAIRFSVVFLSTITLASTTFSADSTAIVPLEVGCQWVGVSSTFVGKDTTKVPLSICVSGSRAIRGDTWFQISWQGSAESTASLALCRIGKDGMNFGVAGPAPESDINFVSFLVFEYPARPGDAYASGIEDSTYVRSLDTVITVPAGSFHCLCYESRLEGVIDEPNVLWFVAPGVGWVKEVARSWFKNGISNGHLAAVREWELTRVTRPDRN